MMFKYFKDLQNTTFKMFNNLRFFISVRHSCSWQHPSTS